MPQPVECPLLASRVSDRAMERQFRRRSRGGAVRNGTTGPRRSMRGSIDSRSTAEEFVANAIREFEAFRTAGRFLHLHRSSRATRSRDGDCYMQDPSTPSPASCFDPAPGENVLDACAAPGGKSGYLAETDAERGRSSSPAIAIETRLGTAAAKISFRLGVTNARTLRCDWTERATETELAEQSFDQILLDAPCTNTGVMRRRVDVRWRLQPEDFSRMPRQQLDHPRGGRAAA